MTVFPKFIESPPHSNAKSAIFSSIKRSVAVFLLLAFAATLSSHLFIRRVWDSSNSGIHPPETAFDSAILDYAATDLGQSHMRADIDLLLGDTANFSGRYRVSPKLRRFRIHEFGSRSQQFSRYWEDFRRELTLWRRRMAFDDEIMNELGSLVKRQIRFNGSFTSCAVVGNSGILLEKEHGSLIDSHDVVIRLNNARTTGFETRVGSKTTISFINSNILHQCWMSNRCACQPYGAEVSTVMYLCQAIHMLDYNVCKTTHTAALVVTDARFDALCARIVKYYSVKGLVERTGKEAAEWGATHDDALFHYSSGMQAVMLAVGMCRRVGLFGFGKSASAKHHYHTDQKEELKLHDYKAEMEFYSDLVKNPTAVPFVSRTFSFPSVTIHT